LYDALQLPESGHGSFLIYVNDESLKSSTILIEQVWKLSLGRYTISQDKCTKYSPGSLTSTRLKTNLTTHKYFEGRREGEREGGREGRRKEGKGRRKENECVIWVVY
jgi:hypothetical protein